MIADPNDSYHSAFATALQRSAALGGGHLSIRSLDEPNPVGPQKPSLVVTLGEKAAAHTSKWAGPLLHVLITDVQFRALYPELVPQGHSALFLEQPVERHIALVRAALPNVIRLIVPVGAKNQKSRDSLRHAAVSAGVSLSEEKVATPQELDALVAKANPNSDAILLLPDSMLRTNAMLKIALVGAYKRQIPLVAYSEGMVMAGALMAVHSTIPLLAEETSALIDDFLKMGRLPPPSYPSRFDVSVNYQLAKSLGLRISSTSVLAVSIQGAARDR